MGNGGGAASAERCAAAGGGSGRCGGGGGDGGGVYFSLPVFIVRVIESDSLSPESAGWRASLLL